MFLFNKKHILKIVIERYFYVYKEKWWLSHSLTERRYGIRVKTKQNKAKQKGSRKLNVSIKKHQVPPCLCEIL